jgi:hypothetical protein
MRARCSKKKEPHVAGTIPHDKARSRGLASSQGRAGEPRCRGDAQIRHGVVQKWTESGARKPRYDSVCSLDDRRCPAPWLQPGQLTPDPGSGVEGGRAGCRKYCRENHERSRDRPEEGRIWALMGMASSRTWRGDRNRGFRSPAEGQ